MTAKNKKNVENTLKRCKIPKNYILTNHGTIQNGYMKVPKTDVSANDFSGFVHDGEQSYSFASTKASPGQAIKDPKATGKDKRKAMVFENKPMKVKMVGYLDPYNNQKVPLVQLPTGQCVAMEIDVFVEGLQHGNMSKDMFLKGEYIVASYSSTYRLIRKDSNLYKTIIENMRVASGPKLGVGELERGRAYRTPGGSSAVFLGYVCTTRYKAVWPNGSSGRSYHSRYDTCDEYTKTPVKKATLWMDYSDWVYRSGYNSGGGTKKSRLQKYFNDHVGMTGYQGSYSVKKTHSFVEKLDTVINVPDNVIMQISNANATEALRLIKESKAPVKTNYSWSRQHESRTGYLQELFGYSEYFNMTLFGLNVESAERPEIMEEGNLK